MKARATDLQLNQTLTSEQELREILGHPNELVLRKEQDHLDAHSLGFIALSPMLLISTSGRDGRCDVSPRGDGPGFVRALDQSTLVVPERPGNRRGDSLTNILENPHAGLLFLIPGHGETLRVNGHATIFRDPDVLEGLSHKGKTPTLGIAVQVEEVFLHCARAFRRSSLWKPDSWPSTDGLASFAVALRDHADIQDRSVEDIQADIDAGYESLY